MAQRRRSGRHSTAQPPEATEVERAQESVTDADIADRQPAPRLAIYIAEHCEICEYALEVAAWIRQSYPRVDLQIVDIHQTTEPVPECVFATPTYLLNGQVWSLGNPSADKINTTFGELTGRICKE